MIGKPASHECSSTIITNIQGKMFQVVYDILVKKPRNKINLSLIFCCEKVSCE